MNETDRSETDGARGRARARAGWPVHIHPLDAQPSENLSDATTAAERLAMMWPLAREAWQLAGRPTERVPRSEMRVRCVRLADGTE